MKNKNYMTDNGSGGVVNGIKYTWGLASSAGAWFVLYPELQHTAEDVRLVKSVIKSTRDAVSIRVIRQR